MTVADMGVWRKVRSLVQVKNCCVKSQPCDGVMSLRFLCALGTVKVFGLSLVGRTVEGSS